MTKKEYQTTLDEFKIIPMGIWKYNPSKIKPTQSFDELVWDNKNMCEGV